MFNFKEFIVKNLIEGVQNGSFTKPYASILAANYVLKGVISEEDAARFDEETKIEEIVETPVEIENESNITEEPLILE